LNHPNAAAAAVLTGPAAVIVWLAERGGIEMPATVAVTVGGFVIAFGLLVGRKGIRGIARILWRGSESA
jgi:hypothetical protein